VAGVSGTHSEIGPELRQLAQAILDKIDPAVRAAATAAGRSDSPGKCQQVWCPVCALAALMSGEQHPLLTVIAEHSVALLAVVRAMVDDIERSGRPTPPDDGGPAPDGEPPAPGRYQHIPVTVEE
jgi:hypothetical protein